MLQAEFPAAAAVGVPARTPLGGGPAPDQCTTAWPDLPGVSQTFFSNWITESNWLV